jgi:hypothetical protein
VLVCAESGREEEEEEEEEEAEEEEAEEEAAAVRSGLSDGLLKIYLCGELFGTNFQLFWMDFTEDSRSFF